MKFALFCLIGFVCMACVFSDTTTAKCNPDGNNMPDCTSDAVSGPVRDFWDPTHYWECQNGAAVLVACPDQQLFDVTTNDCINYADWTWTPPCPSAETS